MPSCIHCGDEDVPYHERRDHPNEVTIKPNGKHHQTLDLSSNLIYIPEYDVYTIKRTASYQYPCPLCSQKHGRPSDIRKHVADAHTHSPSQDSSYQAFSTVPDTAPQPSKRQIDHAEDEPTTPKRLRLVPSSPISLITSSPPSPVPYAISEPQSDLTLVPMSPMSPTPPSPNDKSKQIPQIPPLSQMPSKSTRQSGRREVLKTFTLQQAGIYFHFPTRLFLCVECTTAVPSHHLFTHVNESCPRSVRYDRDVLALKLQELDPKHSPILPLEGLDAPIPLLPIIEGWRCASQGPCHGQVFGAESTKNNHHKDHHSHQAPSFLTIQCQRVFKARNRTRYVAINFVANPADHMVPMSSWRDVKKRLEDEGSLTIQDDRAVTHMQLSSLENVTKWHLTFTGAHLGFARIYSRQPEPAPTPTIHHRLFDAFKQYMIQVVAPVLEMRSNTMLLRLINSSDK